MKPFIKAFKALAVTAALLCTVVAGGSVFAAETYNYDGSTEVVARVESPAETTAPQSGQTDGSSKSPDSSSVKTGGKAVFAGVLALAGLASLTLLLWGLKQKS